MIAIFANLTGAFWNVPAAAHMKTRLRRTSSPGLAFALVSMMHVSMLSGATPAGAAVEAPMAPAWDISQWINSDGLKLADLRGQVVIIDFFQMWCPGCNKFSLPLMHHWEQVFAAEIAQKKLTVLSIHTVFEGHKHQTVKRLRRYVVKKGIKHPVGVDRHEGASRLPNTMIRYKTNGTPEMAFIDKEGRIRFQKFGYFDPDAGEALVRALLDE